MEICKQQIEMEIKICKQQSEIEMRHIPAILFTQLKRDMPQQSEIEMRHLLAEQSEIEMRHLPPAIPLYGYVGGTQT